MRAAVASLAVAAVLARGAWGGGIGVLGDSYSDEYQFYPPNRSAARNWVEILAGRGADFGGFSGLSRGEPRNQGYAYNWARSGATSADLGPSGQLAGLVGQIERGEVSSAVVFVGGNDVIDALREDDPRAALEGLGRRVGANIRAAVESLREASPSVKILVATVPDVLDLPEFRDPSRAGCPPREVAALARSETESINAEIRRLAAPGSGVATFDFARISRASRLMFPKYVTVAGRRVDRESPGDTPEHLFLGDVRHLGTMGQGMLAKFLVDALNRHCGAGIKPLEEAEIAAVADAVAPKAVATATGTGY